MSSLISVIKEKSVVVPVAVFSLVLLASLLGIFTRPLGHLAALWPTNALLLGVLVRFPGTASPSALVGAVFGYLAADLLTGGSVLPTLLLTAGNLVSVMTGYLLYRLVDEAHRRLRQPFSVPILVLDALAASAAAGVVGAIADPLLFHGTPASGWAYWLVTEMVNYMALLPAILSFPAISFPKRGSLNFRPEFPRHCLAALPAIAVCLSALLAMFVGGPGAFVFPIPALLWCALTYGVFGTAIMTLLYSAWVLISISSGFLPLPIAGPEDRASLLSVRLGISFVALGPITVASVMAMRDHLLRQTRHLADYDCLTGLLNRRAFYDGASAALNGLSKSGQPAVVLMMDIDRFKSVNDTYGHAAGDKMLVAFCRQLGASVRHRDIIGRLGGEEFGVLLPACERQEAEYIANRIRQAFSGTAVEIGNGNSLHGTVSIGAALTHEVGYDLDRLLSSADAALYQAKQTGRDRVVINDGRAESGRTPDSANLSPRD